MILIVQERAKQVIEIAVQSFKEGFRASSSSSSSTVVPLDQRFRSGYVERELRCKFYDRVGACRLGPSCDRFHIYPTESETLLVKNMFDWHRLPPTRRDLEDPFEVIGLLLRRA